MPLTPEEKKKILEEERAKAKKTLEKSIEVKKKTELKILLGLIVFVIVFISGIYWWSKSPARNWGSWNTSTSQATIDLNASVRFTGTQFVIVNKNNFDWTNVKLEVNSGLLKGGFVLKTPRMSAGETYTMGAMQFAKGDGTRLNPFTMKPQNLSIWCDTPRGDGFWYGGWE